MTTTDVLTRAVGAWVTEVATKLDAGRLGVLRACLEAPDADVRLVVELREGALILEATTTNGKRLELYREEVHPLRPTDNFGHGDDSLRH